MKNNDFTVNTTLLSITVCYVAEAKAYKIAN